MLHYSYTLTPFLVRSRQVHWHQGRLNQRTKATELNRDTPGLNLALSLLQSHDASTSVFHGLSLLAAVHLESPVKASLQLVKLLQNLSY